MKFKPPNNNSSAAIDARGHDAQIDAALRVYGRAVPAPGLESRVAARIAAAPRHSFRTNVFGFNGGPRLILLRGFTIGALTAAAACAIVVGTVKHSQHIAIPQTAAAPRPGGVSTSEAPHIPTHAVPQSASIDPQAPRSAPHTRATISRKPAAGTAPRSPYPPDQPSSSAPQH